MRNDASALLDLLYICAFLVAFLYIALVVWVVATALHERWDHRHDTRRWARIDEEAAAFRHELDAADWQEEMRRWGRAA